MLLSLGDTFLLVTLCLQSCFRAFPFLLRGDALANSGYLHNEPPRSNLVMGIFPDL